MYEQEVWTGNDEDILLGLMTYDLTVLLQK